MNYKPILAVAAALCIIVLGALLPELTARRQDNLDQDVILFSQMEGVELEFSGSDTTLSSPLAILAHSRDAVEIPQELTSLKSEKASQIAETMVKKFHDAGALLSDPKNDTVLYAQPLLYYGPENQSNIFWAVQYGDRAGTHSFGLVIDDRTGTVCSIEYVDDRREYEPEQMEGVLQSFCKLYLTDLGDGSIGLDAQELTLDAKAAQDNSYLATELLWEDPTYGGTRITFFVNRTGFYTYFDRAAR